MKSTGSIGWGKSRMALSRQSGRASQNQEMIVSGRFARLALGVRLNATFSPGAVEMIDGAVIQEVAYVVYRFPYKGV